MRPYASHEATNIDDDLSWHASPGGILDSFSLAQGMGSRQKVRTMACPNSPDMSPKDQV